MGCCAVGLSPLTISSSTHTQRGARKQQAHATATAAVVLCVIAGLLAGAPRAARAFNCGGQPFQTITVAPSSNIVGVVTTYTINTAVPTLNGCDVGTGTTITVVFPGNTVVTTITSGTVNGQAIASFSKSGQTVSFTSPVAVANGLTLQLVLNGVTNPNPGGSVTLTMAAAPVQNGSVGTTTSSHYIIAAPTATLTPTLSATPTQTNTFTPSLTPTITLTPTLTGTPTVTATPTPTPTNTPVPGLCIAPLATNPCIPGGGAKKTDCNVEFAVTPVPLRTKAGIPKNKLVCYEGDPACDFDANLANNSCTFHSRLCINNHDPRLTTCVPTTITTFEVKAPNPSHLKDSADIANLASLENRAGPGGFGVTVARGVTQVYIGAPNSTPDSCGAPFDLQVPLRQTMAGRVFKKSKRIKLKTNAAGIVDTDSMVLECRPSTCGDHVIQADHETCDDGNRINGDGCDAGCHIEVPPTPTLTFTVVPPSATPTPSPTPVGPTFTPALTFTPSLTAMPTLTATPTNTVLSIGTATATPSSTPVPLSRTCTFHAGSGLSQVRVFTSLGITLNVNLTGHQTWNFSAPAGDGTRAMAIPASGTHFDGVIALGLVKVCPRSGGDGTGIIDCNGGVLSGYNTLSGWDHNTTDPPGVEGGDAQDSACSATSTNPGGQVTNAKLEVGRCSGDLTTHCTSDADCTGNGTCGVGRCTGDGTTPCTDDSECSSNGTCGGYNGSIHPTICNGPLRITQSGPFAAGGMRLNESLFVRILSTTSDPCPADNAPFDSTMGDIALSGTITSGNASGTVYDVMDNSAPWPLTMGDLIDGTRCCQSGASAGHFCSANNNCSNMDCVASPSCTGAAFGCTNITNNVLNTGGLSLSIPVLDLVIPTFGDADLVGTLLLVCN